MKAKDLALFTSIQLQTTRKVFADAGCVEVLTSALEPAGYIPFQNPITAYLGDMQMNLATSPDPYLSDAVNILGKVYTIAPAFRAESDSSRIPQFHYAQAWMSGCLEDGIYLIERIFCELLEQASQRRVLSANTLNRLRGLKAPFQRVLYSDALSALGMQVDHQLQHEDHLKLCHMYGDLPIIITNFLPDAEKGAFDVRRTSMNGIDTLLNFELITPFAGEVASGREIENRREVLENQFSSSAYFSDLESLSEKAVDTDQYIERLTARSDAVISVGFGVERLTQYFLGAANIHSAIFAPVTLESLQKTVLFSSRG